MKTTIWITAVALALIVAVGVKLLFFPALKDTYFVMTQRSLLKVPAGIVVIRPTHYPTSVNRKGAMSASNNGTPRLMGRDVPLSDIIAMAWSEPKGRVLMPPGAPTNNYDFLVTVAKEPQKHLQEAIRSQFGYTAQKESHDTDVLALKIENPNLPGLTVSGPDEKQNGDVKNGRLYLTHMAFKEITRPFEQMLGIPVVDQTGLTNSYNFSLEWNSRVMASFRSPKTARATVDKMLTEWGLGLEPDTAPVDMLVVKKAN